MLEFLLIQKHWKKNFKDLINYIISTNKLFMKRIILFFAAIFTAVTVFGQNQLPNDPAVRKGKLENGLTYYIRHNDKPADRAEFYLATNVGAIQETPDQDGLAHFLEHMCFNGTKNFPGKGILEYLQSIGAEFGRNINAATGVEQTTYMLNNIPLVRESVIDTCLLILHDYSHFVTCAPEEIDKERGVIIEERRARRNANWRMHEKSLPYYYGDSKYSTCTLIGSQENLETFKPESLTNFYHTWYRPDLQAVIVVGDVDVDAVEAKIQKIFADIPASVNPQPKEMHKVPGNTEPLIGIITDPEANSTSMEILWKGEPMPEELNSTDMGMMMNFIKYYVSIIMAERFGDITAKADAPFVNANLGIGELCETMEATFGNISCKDGEGIPAFKAFMTEIEKMKRFGFSDDEVSRAKENILSMYEKAATGADSRQNGDFIDALTNNFFDNYSYMDPKAEYETAKLICSQINAVLLNQVVAGIITDNNMVILYKAPQKEGLTHPTEQDFINAIAEVKASEITPNEAVNTSEPLMDASVLKGSSIKKTSEITVGGKKVQEWILKNGVKVVVLPTEYKKDQIIMNLSKDGGSSIIATEDLPSFEPNVFGLFLNNTGLSKFPGTTLSKMLAGKNVSVSPFISNIRHGISANCTPKDLETAFQLMYLTFTEPRFDQEEFQTGIEHLKAVLPNLMNQPSFKFQHELTNTLYGNNPRKAVVDMDMLGKANLETIERVYRNQLFKDAAGTTLYITGNVDIKTLKPLVEKYIGSLPKGKKATEWIDNNEDIVKGKIENHFDVTMETPKSTVVQVYSSNIPYSVKDNVILDAAKYILDMIYVETLREDEGGTYGAQVGVGMKKSPKETAVIQVYFDTNPESADKLRELAVAGINKLMNEGPTDEQLVRTIENFKKNIPENRINNGWWLSNLQMYYNYGIDYDKEYEAAIKEINAENIKAVLKTILSQGNFAEIVMSPAK